MSSSRENEARQICFNRFVTRGNRTIQLDKIENFDSCFEAAFGSRVYVAKFDDEKSLSVYPIETNVTEAKSIGGFCNPNVIKDVSLEEFDRISSNEHFNAYSLVKIDKRIPTKIRVSISAYPKKTQWTRVGAMTFPNPTELFELSKDIDLKPIDYNPIILDVWGPKGLDQKYRYVVRVTATEYIKN